MKAKISNKEKKLSSEEKLQIHLKKFQGKKEEYLKNLKNLKLNDSIETSSNTPESQISVKKIRMDS